MNLAHLRVYLFPAGVFLLLKSWRTTARTEDLQFLLWPTHRSVECATGVSGDWVPGEGYYFSAGDFLIDASCAGFTFFLLAFAVLTAILVPRYRRWWCTPLALVVAWPCTLLANTSRIVSIEWLHLRLLRLTGAAIHEFQGGVVYLSFLVALYLLATALITPKQVVR